MYKFLSSFVVGCLALGGVVSASEKSPFCYYPGTFESAQRYFKDGPGLRERAKAGDAEAQFQLGRVFRKLDTLNETEARKWFLQAAKQGHGEAQFELGLQSSGLLVRSKFETDIDQATRWFVGALESGYWPAIDVLRSEGDGSRISQEMLDRFMTKLRKAAKSGDGVAAYHLASALWYRKETPQAKAEAIRFYRLAMEQGHDQAVQRLASIMMDPQQEIHDPMKAKKLLEDAARMGVLTAHRVAKWWLRHKDVATDATAEARKWFETSVQQRDACSTRAYALRLRIGLTFEKNSVYADQLVEQSYEFGYPRRPENMRKNRLVIASQLYNHPCKPAVAAATLDLFEDSVISSSRVRQNWQYVYHVCQGLFFMPGVMALEGPELINDNFLPQRPFDALVALWLAKASGFRVSPLIEQRNVDLLHRSERRDARLIVSQVIEK